MKKRFKNKQKQKQKQKQSIVVNIDNSRKSVKRGGGQRKQHQQQPTIIPQPIYIPQAQPQYNFPPPYAHSNPPVFNANPPNSNPPNFDSNPPNNNPPIFDANPPSTPIQTPISAIKPSAPFESDSEIETITPVIRKKKVKMKVPDSNPPSQLLESAQKAGFQHTPAMQNRPITNKPVPESLFSSVIGANDDDEDTTTTPYAPIFTRPRYDVPQSVTQRVTDGRQCKAITAKGTQCTRAGKFNGYCATHAGSTTG